MRYWSAIAPRLMILLVLTSWSATFAQSPAVTTTGWKPLDCRFVLDGPFLKAIVSGKEGYFAVDTGSSTSCIDIAFANEAHIPIHRAELRPDQIVPDQEATNVSFAVSGQEYTAARVYCTSFKEHAESMGIPIVGILGGDWLRTHVVRLDYGKETIERWDGDEFHYAGDGRVVPISATSSVAVTLCVLAPQSGESRGVYATLDTGFNGDLMVSRSFARSAGLKLSEQQYLDDGIGIDGRAQGSMRMTDLRNVSICGLDLGPTEAEVTSTPDDCPVTVGGGLLGEYVVVVDFARSRFIFEQRPADSVRVTEGSFGQLETKPTGDGVRISYIRPGSTPEKKGLRVGDLLVLANGKSIIQLKAVGMHDIWRESRRLNKEITFTFRRGSENFEVVMPIPEDRGRPKP